MMCCECLLLSSLLQPPLILLALPYVLCFLSVALCFFGTHRREIEQEDHRLRHPSLQAFAAVIHVRFL